MTANFCCFTPQTSFSNRALNNGQPGENDGEAGVQVISVSGYCHKERGYLTENLPCGLNLSNV